MAARPRESALGHRRIGGELAELGVAGIADELRLVLHRARRRAIWVSTSSSGARAS